MTWLLSSTLGKRGVIRFLASQAFPEIPISCCRNFVLSCVSLLGFLCCLNFVFSEFLCFFSQLPEKAFADHWLGSVFPEPSATSTSSDLQGPESHLKTYLPKRFLFVLYLYSYWFLYLHLCLCFFMPLTFFKPLILKPYHLKKSGILLCYVFV